MKKNKSMHDDNIQQVLEDAVALARQNDEGSIATYIPELAAIDENLTSVAVWTTQGQQYYAGDSDDYWVTLQSTAKVALLIGMLEEFGPEFVYQWVLVEPSGDDFASLARLDRFGPLPSNPMLNAGAIALCSQVPGTCEQRFAWLERWMAVLFNTPLGINFKVFTSERHTGDRNRSLAYLLKSNKVITEEVDTALETYFYLCSFHCRVSQAAYLPLLLANRGCSPQGEQVISIETVRHVLAIMATCGLYNESGSHLVYTGLPSKSGVSGFILASALSHAGIAVFSPRVNPKGTSVRGEIMLRHIVNQLHWHFAG